jgi:hypothetical protein
VDPSQVDLSAPPAFYGKEEVKPAARSAPKAASGASVGQGPDPEFNVLASALFSDGSGRPTATGTSASGQAAPAPASDLFGSSSMDDGEEEVLRMPSRSVTVSVKKSKPKEALPAPVPASSTAEESAVAAAPVTSPSQDEKKGSIFDRVKGGIKGMFYLALWLEGLCVKQLMLEIYRAHSS